MNNTEDKNESSKNNDKKEKAAPEEEEIIHDSKKKKNESDNDTKTIKNNKKEKKEKKENSNINEVSNDTSANTNDIFNQNFENPFLFNLFNSILQSYLNGNFMSDYFLNNNNNLQYLNNMNNFNINTNLQNQEQQLNNTLNSNIIINRILFLFLLNLINNQILFVSTEANIKIEEDSNIPGYKKVTKIKYKSIFKKEPNNKKTKINLEKIKNGKEKRTSIIVKNIPFHLNVYEIIKIIDEKLKIDFKKRNRTYNYIYVPPGEKYGKNRGFFFINFVSPKHIIKFYKGFEGTALAPNKRKKICHISFSYSKFKTRAQIIFNDIENNLENL